MKKRLFLAIPLSEYFNKILEDYSKNFEIEGIRWTPPENLHITVYFLGYVEEEFIAGIIANLERLFSKMPCFDLEFDKILPAPPGRSPRMIWANFSDAEGAYRNLVDSVYSALEEFVSRDNRSRGYIAHVTLARFNNPKILKEIELPRPEPEDRIMEIGFCSLMESKLSRNGPSYTEIKRFSLS